MLWREFHYYFIFSSKLQTTNKHPKRISKCHSCSLKISKNTTILWKLLCDHGLLIMTYLHKTDKFTCINTWDQEVLLLCTWISLMEKHFCMLISILFNLMLIRELYFEAEAFHSSHVDLFCTRCVFMCFLSLKLYLITCNCFCWLLDPPDHFYFLVYIHVLHYLHCIMLIN